MIHLVRAPDGGTCYRRLPPAHSAFLVLGLGDGGGRPTAAAPAGNGREPVWIDHPSAKQSEDS